MLGCYPVLFTQHRTCRQQSTFCRNRRNIRNKIPTALEYALHTEKIQRISASCMEKKTTKCVYRRDVFDIDCVCVEFSRSNSCRWQISLKPVAQVFPSRTTAEAKCLPISQIQANKALTKFCKSLPVVLIFRQHVD